MPELLQPNPEIAGDQPSLDELFQRQPRLFERFNKLDEHDKETIRDSYNQPIVILAHPDPVVRLQAAMSRFEDERSTKTIAAGAGE
jgi:hypothetical protein